MYLGVPVATNCAKMMEIDSARFGPTLTSGLIPKGFTHHPDIWPVASAPTKFVPRESVNRRGSGECATGTRRPADRIKLTLGLVAIASLNGVVVMPLPRFSRVGEGSKTSNSKPLALDQPALRVSPETGPRISELRASISLSTAQTWTPGRVWLGCQSTARAQSTGTDFGGKRNR